MSRRQLCDYLKQSQGFKSKRLEKAFEHVNRRDFVPGPYQKEVYGDFPLPIGFGGTISQPSTVLFMLNLLDPRPSEKILDVGSGSGWTTALLASIVGPMGKVSGTDIIPELVEFGNQNLSKYKFKNAEIVLGGKKPGLPDQPPFDRILVSAAAETMPEVLQKQLKIGGRMVLPIKSSIFVIDRKSTDT